MLPEIARNCGGRLGEHLLAAGVPGVQAVEEVPVPSVAMKESIFTRVTRMPLTSPTSAPISNTATHRHPPRQPLTLQADRQHLRDADVEAGGQVELVGGHRDEHGERDQRLHRLVVEDRADVEEGEEGVGPRSEKTMNSRTSRISSPQTEIAAGDDRRRSTRDPAAHRSCQRLREHAPSAPPDAQRRQSRDR